MRTAPDRCRAVRFSGVGPPDPPIRAGRLHGPPPGASSRSDERHQTHTSPNAPEKKAASPRRTRKCAARAALHRITAPDRSGPRRRALRERRSQRGRDARARRHHACPVVLRPGNARDPDDGTQVRRSRAPDGHRATAEPSHPLPTDERQPERMRRAPGAFSACSRTYKEPAVDTSPDRARKPQGGQGGGIGDVVVTAAPTKPRR